LAFAIGGCASTPSTPKVAQNDPPAGCVDSTGTRLPLDKDHCIGFGRSWNQNQLRSTGQMDVGAALRDLDPSVRITGNP
jgi:hypothetical protein